MLNIIRFVLIWLIKSHRQHKSIASKIYSETFYPNEGIFVRLYYIFTFETIFISRHSFRFSSIFMCPRDLSERRDGDGRCHITLIYGPITTVMDLDEEDCNVG